MEYSFRNKWRTWTYSTRHNPLPECSKCGYQHSFGQCFAFNRKCFICGKLGHLARLCFQKVRQNNVNPVLQEKSQKQKDRNIKRLREYYESKNLMRELPFCNIRNTAFINLLDVSSVVKSELRCLKQKMEKYQETNDKQTNHLKMQFENGTFSNRKLQS